MTNFKLEYNSNRYAKKWLDDVYTNKSPTLNPSSFIYNMYCDWVCKDSLSNLEGTIKLQLIMLLSGLNNYFKNDNKNIKQSIINSYKPHMYKYIKNFTDITDFQIRFMKNYHILFIH